MQDWLLHIINVHYYLTYAVIIFVSFIEGPLLALLCGLLLRIGDFHFIPLYIALMVGDLMGDTFWYSVGRYAGYDFIRRFGKYFSVTEIEVAKVEKVFHRHKDWILIVSKLTMGLGFALVTLVTAGLVRIPYKRYITLNAIGQFVWTGALIAVGYSFGNVYMNFDSIFGRISIVSLLLLVFLALFGFGKYVKNRVTSSQ